MPIVIFAIIVERPIALPQREDNFLPLHFQYLIERIQLLAESRDEMATILFDGSGSFGGLSDKFNSFLYRSAQGRACVNITDAPFFVDSKISAGIQIADMVASVIRIYESEGLFRQTPIGDQFLLAIRRYHRIVERKTMNQLSHDGYDRLGIHRISLDA